MRKKRDFSPKTCLSCGRPFSWRKKWKHSWFESVDKETLLVMMEIKSESEYVTYHIQKIVGIFQAMPQFADGGLVATRPYVSSASYIQRLGDHCKSCHYDYKAKTGDKACPFNSLYWHFLNQHRDKLKHNGRMNMMYSNWDKKAAEAQEALLKQAKKYLDKLESL